MQDTRKKVPNSGADLKETLKLRKLKLEAKRNHIRNLVNKKTRLEMELKGALRSLKKDLRQNGKALREQSQLDEQADPKELTSQILNQSSQDPEIRSLLESISTLQTEVSLLLQPVEILTPEDQVYLQNQI